MHITRAIIKNYRALGSVDITFNAEKNIIVGPNEAGKSTLLEAINLALSGQINGRSVLYDLHPYLFNVQCVESFIAQLRAGVAVEPPFFEIELYLSDEDEVAHLKGTNNSTNEDLPGLSLRAELNTDFSAEYRSYIEHPEQVTSLPIEYYQVVWRTFANKTLNPRSKPIKSTMIDTGELKYGVGPNKYIVDRLTDRLAPAQKAKMSLSYRKMKEAFVADETIQAVNADLAQQQGVISEKVLSVDLDVTSRASWESGIVSKLDSIPFDLIGKGEQNSVKVQLALDAASDCQVFLIEEPENHLSFTNLNLLISKISQRSAGKQLFITTHSTFVLNKLDIGNVLLFRNERAITLEQLDSSTRDYFLKLPGHDTLRLILSSGKTILVEGPSDELIVQKAYKQIHNKLPLEDGVDVITVRGLAFKRFLEIASLLEIETHVVTDNDGDLAALAAKYSDFAENEHIHIHFDNDITYPTLEPQLVRVNGLAGMNTLLAKAFATEAELITHMTSSNNKTECALKIFDSANDFVIPEYIRNAVS